MAPRVPRVLMAFVILSACGGLAAQQVFDIALPAGFPVDPVGPSFTTRTALAASDGLGIHVVAGLPLPANVATQVVTPSGGQAMDGPWSRLSDEVAVYRSVSGELVLVTGLPSSPALVPTGIASQASAFRPVNETTAAWLDPAGGQLLVLRHGAAGASLHGIPSPVALTAMPGFDWGASGDDRVLAMGDPVNRELVVFTGLDGAPAGFSSFMLPLWTADTMGSLLQGFLVTESGTGLAWEQVSSTQTELTFARRFGPGISPLVLLIDPGPLYGGDPVLSLAPIRGKDDNVIVSWEVDTYWEQALVIDSDWSPEVASRWCARELYCHDTWSIARDELLLLAYAGVTLEHRVVSGPAAGTKTLPSTGFGSTVAHFLDAEKANENTLVYLAGAFPGGYGVVIYERLHGDVAPHSFVDPFATGQPRLVTFGAGLIGVLADGPTPTLRLFTLPTVSYAGSSQGHGAFYLFAEELQPQVGVPFALSGWEVAYSGSATPSLGISLGLGAPTGLGPPFSPLAILDLDLDRFLGLIEGQPAGGTPAWPGQWTFPFGFENLPPELAGLALYCQGVQPRGTEWVLSRTMLVVPE